MKKMLVRLGLWMLFLTGVFFSFRQLWDTKKAEEARREAAQLAGITELSGSVRLILPETNLVEDEEVERSAIENKDNTEIKGNTETEENQEAEKHTEVKGKKFFEKQEPLPEEVAGLAKTDLEALQKVNKDVQGWIEIPGTKVSYPIVQGKDNDYYLNRNWKKEDSISGSIFLESTNSGDFSDFHTMIYGHRMRDGTMFGILKNYQKLDFWQEHPWIYLVSEDKIFKYAVFAAYETGVKSIVYRLDLEEKGLEEEFLRFCEESSVLKAGIVPEPGTKVLTLSTCTGRGHASRWVVQGYLTDTYLR